MTLFHFNRIARDQVHACMESPRSKILSHEFVFSLTREQLILFLETFALGDGTLQKGGGLAVNQRDPERLKPLALMAILAGRPVSFNEQTRRGGFSDGVQHYLNVPTNTDAPAGVTTRETYTGTIFCPQVPPTKSFIARRNGQVYATGNSAWQVDENAWTGHGAPVAEEFCGQLTAALISPRAVDQGLNPNDFRFWYDASEVVQDPDRGRTAMEAHDRLMISDASARRDLGYQEDDAPSDAEWEKRAAIAKPINSPTTNPAKSEPAKGEASAERIIGFAAACVQRCRALAGSRLRTQMQKSDSPANLRARIKGVPNWEVACALGADISDKCDPDSLVAGAGDEFLGQMVRLGLEPSIAESVVRRTEEHAARTLFDSDTGDLPDEVLALCAVSSMRV